MKSGGALSMQGLVESVGPHDVQCVLAPPRVGTPVSQEQRGARAGSDPPGSWVTLAGFPP